MLVGILIIVVVCVVLAYIPLTLVMVHSRGVLISNKRPVNEVFADAYAEGQITQERFETLMDEVHASMPTKDAPYPLVHDLR